MRTLVSLIVAVLILPWVAPVASAAVQPGVLPVNGPLVRAFDPPALRWEAGHRGVDLESSADTVVRAPRDGVVTFASELAGRPVLVVSHGDTRSTFEPVIATVAVGTRVRRGDPVGRLATGHDCPAAVCLHWGLRRGEDYLDPLSLVRGEVRLLSDADAAALRAR